MLCCGWLVFSSSDWCISILAVSCSLGGPLSHGSPVVVFFDRGHPRFWNFYSTIPVDVVRVKSYMNCLFDPTCVVMRVTINKLYFVPEWLVSGVVGVHRHTRKKEIPSAPSRSRTYDLPISTSDALPLSYRRLVVARPLN